MKRLLLLLFRLIIFIPLSIFLFFVFPNSLWEWPQTLTMVIGVIVFLNFLILGLISLVESWTHMVWDNYRYGYIVPRLLAALFYSVLIPLFVSGKDRNVMNAYRYPIIWIYWTLYLFVAFLVIEHFLNRPLPKLGEKFRKRFTYPLTRIDNYIANLGLEFWSSKSIVFLLAVVVCTVLISLRNSIYLASLSDPPIFWVTDLKNNYNAYYEIFIRDNPIAILILPFDLVFATHNISAYSW